MMKESIERIEKLIEQDNYNEAVLEMENNIINNPDFLQYATKEELYSYEIIDKLDDSDIRQLLKNVAKNKEEITKDEFYDFMKMNRNFLKVIIFLKISERVTNNSERE